MSGVDLTSHIDRMVALIEQHGWAVQCVFGDTQAEGFSYTVGLTARGLPELWLGTLAPAQAGGILNDLAELACLRGPLAVGVDLDADYSVPFRLRGPVDAQAAEAFVARHFYPQAELMQVLWCDPAGRFPGEQGYDEARFPQRLLPLAVTAGKEAAS